MPIPLRLLFVAHSPAASRAVGLIEQQTPVEALLAPDAHVLTTALRDEGWDGLLVFPDAPIPGHEIARVLARAEATPPLLVVGTSVPEVLRQVGASAVAPGALSALGALLRTVAMGRAAAVRPSPARAPRPAEAPPRAEASAPPAPPTERPSAPLITPPPAAAPTPPGELATHPDAATGIESLAAHLPLGVYRSTPDGRILYANPALATVLGVPDVEQAAALDVRWDLGYPRDAFEAQIRETGEVRNLVVQWTHPSGRTVHTRENARIVRNDRGRVLYYEGTMEDVTEEVRAQERDRLRTRQSATALRFFDAANEAASTADLHQDAAEAFQKAFEADWSVIVRPFHGRNRIVAHQGLADGVVAAVEANEVFATSPIPHRTTLLRTVEHAPGLPGPIRETLAAAGLVSFGCFPMMQNGSPLGSVVVGFGEAHSFSADEIQGGEMLAWHLAGHLARRMAERTLVDTEATLQCVAETTGHVLYRRRYSGEFEYLSPVIETLTGYAPDALIEMGGLDALVAERVVDAGEGLLEAPLADGHEHYLAQCRIETRSGESRWVEHLASPWHDAEGRPLGVVGVLHDVTDRKRREDAQAEAAGLELRRQAALVELATAGEHAVSELVLPQAAEQACRTTAATHASVWLREGARIVRRAAYPASGTAADYPIGGFEAVVQAMAGQRALAIADVAADERAAALGLHAFASSSGATGLLLAPIRNAADVIGGLILHRHGDGARGGEPWTDADIAFAAAVADALALTLERDERAEAQRALAASEARYRTLAELTSDYAFAVHADAEGHGPIAWATDAFARISGYEPEAVGTTRGLADLLHPDSRVAVCQAFAELATTGAVDFEAQIVTRDGEARWVHHRARASAEHAGVVYHSGEDVTERKRFEADLLEARERAEAMGRLKSAFLANMSHEIRTPLTSILGYSDLLLDELEADQRDFVLHIARSGVRLLDTLNSVLDLARLEADGVELQVRPLTVADHVESAIEPYRLEAEQNGLGFHVDVDPAIQAELDPACFQRIVTNLVGNAVKFTHAGGVAVQVEADATHVHLHVRDTGVGMDDGFLENLFTDFQQESFGHNRSFEGTGLGLSITKRYVDLLGGSIGVETQKEVGTSFVVSFPLIAARDAQDDAESPLQERPREASAATSELPEPVATEAMRRSGAPESPARSAPVVSADGQAFGRPATEPQPAEGGDFERVEGSGLGFERPMATADTSSATTDSVSPLPGSSSTPDRQVSHDPSLPTDMFFNRPTHTPDAADVHGETPTSASDEAPSGPPPAAPTMIVRGPAASAPESAPAPWPTAPSAPAAAATPAPPPTAAPTPVADNASGSVTPTQSVAEAGDARPSILVVEDNDDTRMLLDRILRSTYTVTAVGDARSALIEMNRNQFVGLVLDINLGGKETGADILRIARTLDGYTDVFAIALTAYALPGDRERLLEAGFNEYISKPFTRHSLMEALSLGLAH